MNRRHLPEKILLHILSFVDKGTLCTLMQTNRLFLHEGARYLLQDGVSLDENDGQIWSFVSFMLNEGHPRRLKLLQSLRLSTLYPTGPRPLLFPEATGVALARLFWSLSTSGDLRSLSIHGSEQFLGLHPGIPAAIASIETLEWIDVMDAGLHTVSMLGALRSYLTQATIVLTPPDHVDDWMLSSLDGNPMCPLLWRSTDTLERLSIAGSTRGLNHVPWFPHVTSLYLRSTGRLPRTYDYVQAFRNLRLLSTEDYSINIPLEQYGILRATNMHEQALFGTWASLSRYHGSILTLYLLAIRRRIPKIVINNVENSLEPEMLRIVLRDARPRRLEFVLDAAYWLLHADFCLTFTSDGVDALRYFALFINIDPLDDDTDIPAALDAAILQVVKPLQSLITLHITVDFSWYRRFDDDGPQSPDGDPILVPVEEVLAEWDMEAYAHRIQEEVGASGALKSITVGLQGHRTRRDCEVTLTGGSGYEPDVYDDWSDDSDDNDSE